MPKLALLVPVIFFPVTFRGERTHASYDNVTPFHFRWNGVETIFNICRKNLHRSNGVGPIVRPDVGYEMSRVANCSSYKRKYLAYIRKLRRSVRSPILRQIVNVLVLLVQANILKFIVFAIGN